MKTQELIREEQEQKEEQAVDRLDVQENVVEREPVSQQDPGKRAKNTRTLKEPESKYVQQHLANERTFLAWIRTTVSIMGVGLVTTSLHFELSTNFNMEADNLIKIVGYASLFLGVILLAFSVFSYLQKRRGINDGTFRSTSTFVVFMSAFMALIVFLFGMYLFKTY